ncbi:alpha-1,4-glucan--maltose-1-phosphate maltosyltransferase [Tistrella sp. BH-R2-4]|uniref:Alpha-1,4-glucan:maltose-1-phosphate maltosyltransferase n=1 Tax=Tistrella arctica TaxID=3133430 RepID=A0ABU9YLJ5_9PROT
MTPQTRTTGPLPAMADGHWRPRICLLPAATALDPQALTAAAAHGRDLGFSHLLLAGPLVEARVAPSVAITAEHGLGLLVDLDPAAGFAVDGADPRQTGGDHGRNPAGPSGGDAGRQVDRMAGQLAGLAAAGVAGVRCMAPAALGGADWRRVIDRGRQARGDLRAIVWTHGVAAHVVAGLEGCGFDAAVASDAWWNMADDWLYQEIARLARIGSVLTCPEVPFGPRLGETAGSIAAAQVAAARALKLAPWLFDGLILQAGFAWGDPDPLRPDAVPRPRPPHPAFDLAAAVRVANAGFDRHPVDAAAADAAPRAPGRPLQVLTGDGGGLTALLIDGDPARLLLINRSTHKPLTIDPHALLARQDRVQVLEGLTPGLPLTLAPGGVQALAATPSTPVRGRDPGTPARAAAAPRIAIEGVTPLIDGGRYPVRRRLGDSLTVEADIFADGHDVLKAVLRWRPDEERTGEERTGEERGDDDDTPWQEAPMVPVINDRWRGRMPLNRLGRVRFEIMAWRDAWGSYRADLAKKQAAGAVRAVDVDDGLALLKAHGINDIAQDVETAADQTAQVARMLDQETRDAMALVDPRPFASATPTDYPVEVERRRAGYSAWYELFPRSETDSPDRHGRFPDVIRRLPDIRAMGFDVLYMPPIHPIGRTNRKGRNNSLIAGPDDPGSPYAIGSNEGGHDAIHPALGTLDDFRALVRAAAALDMEVALDFAIQCSPDHPWLRAHPDWFAWRSDGSMRYAENPPKRYEDIVNVDFYADGAVPDLWQALRDVVAFWVNEGVRLFRVDNPHTKPFPFWEWLIADIKRDHPDTVFLAEAFTRPKVMYRLAKIGFAQSYTYFTWRHTKSELTAYFTELSTPPVVDFFGPHVFVNTPDINPYFLQTAGRAGFLQRACLASMLSGLWGMYNGFELCEGAALPGREEYLDSEKYEIKPRDWNRPGNIRAEIAMLNRIRDQNPALQDNRGLVFHSIHHDQMLLFSKSTALGDNVVLVAVNLDPHNAHDAAMDLPFDLWGLEPDAVLPAEDLVTGNRFTWAGRQHHLRLDPAWLPFAIWRVRPPQKG